MQVPSVLAQGTQAELALINRLVHPSHHRMLSQILVMEKLGFASLKMENDLYNALGMAFNLEAHGLNQASRRKAALTFAQHAGNRRAGEIIVACAEAVQRSLGLLHLPLGGIGVDVTSRSVREIKSYIRTEWSAEKLVEGVRATIPTPPEGERVALAAATQIAAPDQCAIALSVLTQMQQAGCTLDMVAVDIHGSHTELKLYFAARDSVSGKQRPFSVTEARDSVELALNLCNLRQFSPLARRLIDDMLQLGFPCNLVSVELRQNELHEVKIYYDTWNISASQARLGLRRDLAARAMETVFSAAQRPLPSAKQDRFLTEVYASGMVLDCFTTDFAQDGCGAKTYLRSASDRGQGANMQHVVGELA